MLMPFTVCCSTSYFLSRIDMAISTCQKITFVSCIVLCMSLFLPRMFLPKGNKDKLHSEVGPGHFPPIQHSHSFSEDHVDWNTEFHYTKHYNPEAIAKTKSAGKPNLLFQVIPVYGFGIFLYIIYLFFKLTSQHKPHRQRCRFPILQPEYTFEEMSTCQQQARTSERLKEKRISKVVHPSGRSRRGTRRREEKKLKQLREITQMMWERQLREGVTPEEEAEEAPYTADWEGYPEETYPENDMPCRRRRYPSIILEEPDQVIPTAEELAERMEKEEEEEEPVEKIYEENENKKENDKNEDEQEEDDEEDEDGEENDEEEEEEEEDIGEDQPCLPKSMARSIDEHDEKLKDPGEKEEKQKAGRRRQITFSDHRHVFHYPKGGAVGCKYEEEEEEEHEEEEEDEEEENGGDDDDDDYEEEEDQHIEEGRSETDKEEKEEDPLMEAESLGFNDDGDCDPEEQEVDLINFLQTYQPEVTVLSSQSQPPKAQASGTLRMRNKKQNTKK